MSPPLAYLSEPPTEPDPVVTHPTYGPLLASELDALDREAETQEMESDELLIMELENKQKRIRFYQAAFWKMRRILEYRTA